MPKPIQIEGTIGIVGDYGSGKTELSINLGITQKTAGIDVSIADLDIINPYFRTREAKDILSSFGIHLYVPPPEYLHADLPVLSTAISSLLKNPSRLTILDFGGHAAGATILSALKSFLQHTSVEVLLVINPFRPFMNTIDGCMEIMHRIEDVSGLKTTGIIGNPNIMMETTKSDIYNGQAIIEAFSEYSHLPVAFISIWKPVLQEIPINRFKWPVLPIQRYLLRPWETNNAEMNHYISTSKVAEEK